MKAVIMAGGSGTRLRPLTCDLPKPMAEIASQPALCHIIRLLKRNGVQQAAVTTLYQASQIEALGQEFEGVRLKYYREQQPLGTAGSVRRAAEDFDDDFVVISGDCICDFDLQSALQFHRQKQAAATLVLANRSDPLEYGVVICQSDGKVAGFIEKPDWSQVFSSCVNTGIYILSPSVLSLIPKNQSYDFGKDLFPRMLGGSMYGYEAQGYWCDVGSLSDYYLCNFDAANGKVKGIAKKDLQNGSIIGTDCNIQGEVKDSILHSGVSVGEGSSVQGCIICRNTKIGKNVVIGQGAVIGADCTLEDGCRIGEGVKLYAGIHIQKGSVIMHDMTGNTNTTQLFTDNGIRGSIKDDLTPERCFALGAGCVIKPDARVGVMTSRGCTACEELIKNCIIGGISAAGGVPLDFGEGNRLLSAYAALACRQEIMLYVQCEGDSVGIYPLGADSLSINRETERKILSRLDSKITRTGAHKTIKISGMRDLYITSLVRGKSSLSGLRCTVSDNTAGEMLAEALEILGADVRLCSPIGLKKAGQEGRMCFDIGQSDLNISYGDGFCSDFEHIRAFLVHHKSPALHNIALPYTAPAILDEIAQARGARVLRYLTTPTGGRDIGARTIAADFSQLIFRDPCFAAAQMCEVFFEVQFDPHKLKKVFDSLPRFSRSTRDIDYDEQKRAEVMRKITDNPSPEGEGAQVIFRGGRALVIPRRSGGFRIIAEAVSTEAAKEISFKTERKLYGKEEE